MKLTINEVQSNVSVTILGLDGELDASNFQEVILTAQNIISESQRHLMLDMSALKFISSSGIIALHSIVLLMRGEAPPDLEYGWEAFRSIDRSQGTTKHPFVKLIRPQPKVARTLEVTGLMPFFEIFDDVASALASFSTSKT
jgi:anti-anti-sigma regulatory factor